MWDFISPGARLMQAVAKRRKYPVVTEGIRAEVWRGALVTVRTGFATRADAIEWAECFARNDMTPALARIVITDG